ncbi:hypothetical protein GA0111570_102469 [Raineyella antarctica]|uniref:Uncharacterized protein n=1 Tax=Raineyella antarctica TaxID=1577474 RepID=A0A1G6GFA7_9ACTN|nr:hypothetical protein GA0111570_102469 [Raineyella antarctica]
MSAGIGPGPFQVVAGAQPSRVGSSMPTAGVQRGGAGRGHLPCDHFPATGRLEGGSLPQSYDLAGLRAAQGGVEHLGDVHDVLRGNRQTGGRLG